VTSRTLTQATVVVSLWSVTTGRDGHPVSLGSADFAERCRLAPYVPARCSPYKQEVAGSSPAPPIREAGFARLSFSNIVVGRDQGFFAQPIQLCTTRTRKPFLRARAARIFARSCDR
jgi:hypothetical protein